MKARAKGKSKGKGRAKGKSRVKHLSKRPEEAPEPRKESEEAIIISKPPDLGVKRMGTTEDVQWVWHNKLSGPQLERRIYGVLVEILEELRKR